MVWFMVAVCLGLVVAPLPLPSTAAPRPAPRQKSNPYFHTCRYRARYWDDCVQTVAQELRPLFAEGVPELGVRPIDPLFVDKFDFSEVSGKFRVHLSMKNVTMEGLSDYYVTGVRSNLQELSMEIRLRVPSLTFRAHYHMDGRFLFLGLSGWGTCQYNFTDVDNKVSVHGHLVRRVSDDALHFRVNTLQWTMLPSRGSSHFSASEDDSSVYSHATSRLLNDHGEEGWRAFQTAAERAFAEVFRERINRLMMNIPYRDLFPPGVLPLHLLELPMADNVADEYPPLYWTRPSTTTTTTTTTMPTTTNEPSTTSTSTTTTASMTTNPPTTSLPPVTTTPFAPTPHCGEHRPCTTQDERKYESPTPEPVSESTEAALDAAGDVVFESRDQDVEDASGSVPSVAPPTGHGEHTALAEVIGPHHDDTVTVSSQNAAVVSGAAVAAAAAGLGGADPNQNQEDGPADAAGPGSAAGAVPRWNSGGAQDAVRGDQGVNGVVKEDVQEQRVAAPPRTDLEDVEDPLASFDTAFTLDSPGVAAPAPGALPVHVYIGDSLAGRRDEYIIVDSEGPPAAQGAAVVADAATTADAIALTQPAEQTTHLVWSPTNAPRVGTDAADVKGQPDELTGFAPTSASTEPPALEEATEADNSIPDEDDDDQPLASRGERRALATASTADAAGNTSATPSVAEVAEEEEEDLSPLATLGQVVSEAAKDLIAEVSEVLIGAAASTPAEVAGVAATNLSRG